VKRPPAELVQRLLEMSEQVLRTDSPPRLEDIAQWVGASRATLYYYFSGREDLLSFLLATHAEHGAQAVRAALNPEDPPEQRLRTMVSALAAYLGRHPGTCAGLLGALGANGRMNEVLAANDTWIAGPLRDLLSEGQKAGIFVFDNAADAAHIMLGGILLAVLGRSTAGADATAQAFHDQLTQQLIRGILSP
jgi:TetR/AcrR family transcriptional regulator